MCVCDRQKLSSLSELVSGQVVFLYGYYQYFRVVVLQGLLCRPCVHEPLSFRVLVRLNCGCQCWLVQLSDVDGTCCQHTYVSDVFSSFVYDPVLVRIWFCAFGLAVGIVARPQYLWRSTHALGDGCRRHYGFIIAPYGVSTGGHGVVYSLLFAGSILVFVIVSLP